VEDTAPGGTKPPMSEENLVQLYWALLDTWSAQVDSYWTRTSYFALFVTGAIAGTWAVLDDTNITIRHRYFLVLAVVLTLAWIFSNVKSHDYLMYWWKRLGELETCRKWESEPPNYISAYPTLRKKRWIRILPYHVFTNYLVPIGFFLFWVGLIYGWFAQVRN
jgi:hypothetical protein